MGQHHLTIKSLTGTHNLISLIKLPLYENDTHRDFSKKCAHRQKQKQITHEDIAVKYHENKNHHYGIHSCLSFFKWKTKNHQEGRVHEFQYQ